MCCLDFVTTTMSVICSFVSTFMQIKKFLSTLYRKKEKERDWKLIQFQQMFHPHIAAFEQFAAGVDCVYTTLFSFAII